MNIFDLPVSPTGYTIFSKGYGLINLDGGTLVTKKIDRWGSNDTRVQYINFNGGTLKANEAESLIYARYGYMHVTVGAGGGTIDCNGYPVTIDLAAENDANNDIEGVGGLTFTGGNTITIKSKVSYSGATRVTPGTTLAITHADAKDNILSNGLVVASVPTEEQAKQSIFTYTSAMARRSTLRTPRLRPVVVRMQTTASGAGARAHTSSATSRIPVRVVPVLAVTRFLPLMVPPTSVLS